MDGCDHVIERVQKSTEMVKHTPAEAVVEDLNPATCYAEGSYNSVVYCSVEACKAKLSSEAKTIEKLEHTPAEVVREDKTPATCYAEGSYDMVVYCSVAECKHEIKRESHVIGKTTHTPAEAVRENEVAPKCEEDGSYDLVVYCSVEACKAEISRTETVDPKTGHSFEFVQTVDPTVTEDGYDLYKCQCGETEKRNPTLKQGEEFTVKFVVPYGVEYKASENIYDNYPEVLTAPVYEGYTFEGWSTVPVSKTETKPAMVELLDGKYDADGNTTLYAVFAETTPGETVSEYVKVTNAADVTSGKYVMIVKTGYAPQKYDSTGWLLAVTPTVSGNKVTNTMDAVWTLTVDGSSVTLTDSSGKTIKPKSGNNNGIQTGPYNWAWSFADDTVTFKGTGSDTTTLASNSGSENKFRAYKNATVTGNQAASYSAAFTLYKLVESQSAGKTEYLTAAEYTVSFHTPDGVTAPEAVTVVTNQPINLSEITVSVPEGAIGYTFAGWITAPELDAPEAQMLPGSYEPTADIDLYAVYSYSKNVGDISAWALVTDAKDLAIGDKIVVASKAFNKAMSATQNKNNRASAAIEVDGNEITFDSDVQIITLENGDTANTFAFNVGNGYLYAASSSSNNLKTQTTVTNNGSWEIAIDASGNATVKATGNYSRNWLRYNSSNNLFSCYGEGQQDIQLYKLTTASGNVTYYTTNPVTDPCAAGHHTTVQVEAKEKTCTEAGWEAYEYCSKCDYTTKVEIPAGHELVNVEAKASTCKEQGWNAYEYCSECDYTTKELLPLAEHTPGEKEVVDEVAADCTNDGYYEYVICCTACETELERKTVTVTAEGHDYQVSEVVAPDFDVQGYTVNTCTVCGDSYKDNFTDALIAVAQIGEKLYESFAEAVEKAAAGDEIVLLANAEFSGYADVVINLNGYTLTGEVAATLKMNGGTLVTTKTPHTMAAPSGAKYNTTDAIIAIEPNGNITIVEGTVTLGESWWTGEGQTLTIAEDATFKIPAGLNLNVLSTVKVEGKAEVEGTITLYIASATIESATEIANVVTNIADHKVVYENGVYKVIARNYVAQVGTQKFESLADAIAAAGENATVVVIADHKVTEPVVIEKNIIIDLNGKTLTAKDIYPVIRVQGGANVTVKNGNIINANDYVFVLGSSDKATAGNLTIESGEYVGETTVASVTKGVLTITGGKFAVSESEYGATYLINCYDANLKNGTAKIVVSGGTFVGFNPEENAAENPAVDFTADGYIGVEDGNGNYIVREGEWVAKVGNKKFESLADAIAAADENATVVVIADHKVTEPVVIEKNITIDLNGKTLTAKDIYPVIRVQGGANVTVKNGNIINANDYVFVLGSSDKATAGNLTIESGEYVGETTVASVTKGVLTITGGKFAVSESEYGATYLINCYDANLKNGTAKIVVSGGTFVGFNPEENAAENPAVDFTADGYIGVEDGNGNYIVREGVWVAKIGEKKFETLQAAAGAAVAGDTIVLLTDVAYTGYINNDVVVDLNGKTLTGELSATLKMNGGYLVTAKYAMAGPDNSKYITTDAVMTLLPNGDMTVISGTIELADADWWTLAGQTVTIAKDATFVIPAGKNLNVQGAVIVEGTAIVNGTATLYNTEATIEAAAGMNVVSAVAGKKVAYKNGVYCLIDENVLAWNESTGAEFETVEAALAAAKAGETVKLMGDAVEDAFFVRANIALDLNGFKLTANYVAAMPGSDVIDSSADSTGVLVVDENGFAYAPDNKQLVIKTPDGYRFVDAAPRLVLKQEGEQYKVSVSMTKDGTTDILFAQLIKQYKIENLDLQFRVNVAWTDAIYGEYDLGFRFKDSLAQEAMDICAERGAYTMGMYMYINGAAGLENLTFTGEVVVLDGNGKEIQTITGETIPAVAP